MVNKATLLERIADLVKDRKIEAIRDLRDESSRDGMRIVIELKRGEDAAETLEKLYRSTDLRTNFNVNFVALVDGAPRTLGLLDALRHCAGAELAQMTGSGSACFALFADAPQAAAAAARMTAAGHWAVASSF